MATAFDGRRVVFICPEPIRALQQGVGIRFREMAAAVARHRRVTLWAPNDDIDVAGAGFDISPFPRDNFLAELSDVAAVVVHGHASERYLDALAEAGLKSGPPLVVDLFDPFLVENLRYAEHLGDEIYERDRRIMLRQLDAGDLFLVSSEKQRLFYAGLLMGGGLFDASTFHRDPALAELFAMAPFGVDPDAAVAAAADRGFKGVVPGIATDDIVVFFGGIYDWYDPELLLDASEPLLDRWPIRIVFNSNPNQQTTPQRVWARVHDRARARGLIGRSVFFEPWFPYHERARFYRDVDIAVCLHQPSLETGLSLRTRVLHFMQAALPIVATAGGEAAKAIAAAGAGLLVPPGDASALRAALTELLDDRDRRAKMGAAGRAWVLRERPWSRTLEPLLRFCQAPRKRARAASSPSAGGTTMPTTAAAPALHVDAGLEMTVIVPTRNRKRLLAEVLAALDTQQNAAPFEVVVVDDGSTDGTPAWIGKSAFSNVRIITQPPLGPAAARNRGLAAARGRRVAFLGDDTVPEPRWLASHLEAHANAGDDPHVAVLGRIVWHPRMTVTPFLEHIGERGAQFGFGLIADQEDVPFNFFYTSNISLNRDFARRERFNEQFPSAAWEDIELAYRLSKRGLRIKYHAAARVAHDHPTNLHRFLQRQERVGHAAVILFRQHPELGPLLGLTENGPPPLPSFQERALLHRARLLDWLRRDTSKYWNEALRLSYLKGLHRGWLR
jgi:glycosyltransferase involved in cell wall biosynthesis